MTPSEKRLYRAAQKRTKREVARERKNTEWRGRPQRVYADDDETAKRIAGPMGVAVKRVTVTVSLARWERTRRTARFLKACGMDIDTSRLIELNLDAVLDELENHYNNGQPCPHVELKGQKRPTPIPRAKKASQKI